MIRFFNANGQHITLLLLLTALVLAFKPFLFIDSFPQPEVIAPFSKLIYSTVGKVPILLAVLSVLLLFLQALLINRLLADIKMFERSTAVPGTIHILVSCLIPEFLMNVPVLIVGTLLLIILRKLLALYNQQHCLMEIFDSGLLMGLCTLFYFPSIIIVLLLFVALSVFRAFNWKEWMVGLCGFLTVYFLTGTVYYVIDGLPFFLNDYMIFGLPGLHTDFTIDLKTKILVGVIGLLTMGSFFLLQQDYLRSSLATRKFVLLNGWLLVLLALSFLFSPMLTVSHFLILSVPLSVFLSYLFMKINRLWLADTLHLILFVTVLVFQYVQ